MLVLSRKKDESFWIGDDVRITVLSVTKGRVKLGIEAPRTIGVRRGELHPAEASARANSQTPVKAATKTE